ncbi:rhamnan synthesis F family protein [Paenibacillus timonensis]|uniref:Rhamnan synthesis F family protein n=1 Tax=Paenibacillus timonensis TaxID=225915 RepID=A0ABW3SG29_9BACL|nr:rhamnan synthesis F family protein [Paenibacillus timonensis]MCH1642337.1 rhamnan synthesis F family protein [Paenibacillus timonensis]
MNVSNESSKRAGIFFFFDNEGIVDRYILHLLNDIKKSIGTLLIVCNGKLMNESRKLLEKVATEVLVRENKGFDVWAYKEGLEYIGWDSLELYEELVLFNSTIFGPLTSFDTMFADMSKRDIDFWGITKFHKVDYDPFGTIKYGYIPEHIQSHFIVVRNKMLKSFEFRNYWSNMREVNSYIQAIGYHEAIFTKDFSDKGFSWDVYVNTDDLEGYTYHPVLMMPLELIKNRKCPIIKRRSFFHDIADFLNNTTGEQTIEAYEFIKENFDYDTDMIWENILRTNNQADIKNAANLNYVLSSDMSSNNHSTKKIALVMHIYFDDKIEYCLDYAKSMPPETDVYVTTNNDSNKLLIEEAFKGMECANLKVIVIPNRGRDVSSLLIGVRDYLEDYDYVCFAHDKKTKQVYPYIKGESFAYKCFENILKNRHLVNNIIRTFDENPKLGLLSPPPPNHADFYFTIGYEWSINLDITRDLAKKIGIVSEMEWHKEPIAPLGTMFWFRPKALKALIEYKWEYKDFPQEPNNVDGTLLHAIERIYPYVAQYEGYYSAWVLVDSFARIEITNLYYMLRQINLRYFEKCGPTPHYGMITGLSNNLRPSRSYQFKQSLKKYLPTYVIEFLKKIRNMTR